MRKVILSCVIIFAFMGCHKSEDFKAEENTSVGHHKCEKVENDYSSEINDRMNDMNLSNRTIDNFEIIGDLQNMETIQINSRSEKPAIYLYPTKNEKIEVKLEVNGDIIKTIPTIVNNGWIVNVTKDGKIDEKYDYLFYENTLNTPLKLSNEGWVVKKENIATWCDTTLPKLGLNSVEIKDFKEYWVERLQVSPYYQIKLLENDYLNENMKLKIKPKPDTLIRIMFKFDELDKEIKLSTPKLITPTRNGFTAVEWGGIRK